MADLIVQAYEQIQDVPAASWKALTARSPASVTGSRAWLEAALATVDRDADPYLLTVCDGDRPVGLMTLVSESGPRPRLRFAAAPFNDLTDLLVCPGYEAAASAAVLHALRGRAREGWTVELMDLDPAGSLAAGDPQRRLLRWEPSWSAPTLRLDGNDLPRPSRRRRRNWDRALAQLTARHRVEIRFVTGSAMLTDLKEFTHVRDIRLRAKKRNLHDPPLALLEAAVRRLAPLERCGFMELHVADLVVARDLYLLDGSVAMLWLRALCMDWLRYSCGHLLLRASSEHLAIRGFHTIDFGRGAEEYKFAFGAQDRVLLTARANRYSQ
jgi:CelD/BcsL family acetyltransferase involved in cellulose biosynthesis